MTSIEPAKNLARNARTKADKLVGHANPADGLSPNPLANATTNVARPAELTEPISNHQPTSCDTDSKTTKVIDQSPSAWSKFSASIQATFSTLRGGFSLAWEANPRGTIIRAVSALTEAASPVAYGLLIKEMIDTIAVAGPLNQTALITVSGCALAVSITAAVLRSLSNRASSLTSQALEKITDTRVAMNLAARYEEVFSADKNSQVVMLRENMWRITFLPDTALAVAGVGAYALGAAFALSSAPTAIIVAAVVVASLPIINQLIQAHQVHRDETAIAGTRRKYWYQSYN